MPDHAGRRSDSLGVEASAESSRAATLGKRTLVEQLPVSAVQRRAAGGAPTSGPTVHEAAAQGVATPSSPLPHGSTIQQLFGRHDISNVQAHTGPQAAASAWAMGAQAYATGNHVVLRAGADLHTVAHEAAHVVQQRGGVQLRGGVGEAGDPYERQADEVADRVVAGQSSEALLDAYGGGGGGGSSAVHRRLVVGGKAVAADHVAAELQGASTAGLVDAHELASADRLRTEARDSVEHTYAYWLAAARGVVQHGAEALGST